MWRPKNQIKQCKDCGTQFEATGGNHKYCSTCTELKNQLRYEWFRDRLDIKKLPKVTA